MCRALSATAGCWLGVAVYLFGIWHQQRSKRMPVE